MRHLTLVLAVLLTFTACRPTSAETQESSVVRFAGSGFSLEPGPGWIRINTRKLNKGLVQVICQPALTTKGGTIQVVQLGDRITEKDAIGQILNAIGADELAMNETLTQRDFQADSGTRVKLFRYTRHTAPDPARILNYLTQYVVRTAGGRWISIGALTDSVAQADDVEAMVKRTLREIPAPTPTPRPK